MPFGLKDNDDRAVKLLEQIAQNTGAVAEEGVDQTINLNGSTADQRVGFVPAGSYITVETADLDYSAADGTVALEPGDSVALAEFDDQSCAVYAVGATDEQDVEYEFRIDNRTVGGRTNSPLGLINTPFSFVNMIGGALPVENSVRYVAHYDDNASGTITLAARLHMEVM